MSAPLNLWKLAKRKPWSYWPQFSSHPTIMLTVAERDTLVAAVRGLARELAIREQRLLDQEPSPESVAAILAGYGITDTEAASGA